MRTTRAWFIPTYNEAENLGSLVAAVRAAMAEGAPDVASTILVVDDNSSDGTGRIADRLAARHVGAVVRKGQPTSGSRRRCCSTIVLDLGARRPSA